MYSNVFKRFIFKYTNIFILNNLFQPFSGDKSPLKSYFPDQIYAIALPTAALIIVIFVVILFVSLVIIRDSRKNSSKEK